MRGCKTFHLFLSRFISGGKHFARPYVRAEIFENEFHAAADGRDEITHPGTFYFTIIEIARTALRETVHLIRALAEMERRGIYESLKRSSWVFTSVGLLCLLMVKNKH